jgi:hypothetical protein
VLGVREAAGWLIGLVAAGGLMALYSPAVEALRAIQQSQGESRIIEESWAPSSASSGPFSCWWTENRAPDNYVTSPIPADTEERCFQLNSCGPGGGQSGGGCYKWAQCATCPATDWSARGQTADTPAGPDTGAPSEADYAGPAVTEDDDSGKVRTDSVLLTAPTFAMPNVVGLTIRVAEMQVRAAARTIRAKSAQALVVDRQSDSRPAGQIIRQLEPPGTQMRPYLDDVGGTYGQVTFRVVVSTGPGDYSCWWMENREPYNFVPWPSAGTEERCFQLNSCGPGGGLSGGGCYKWAECATCPGVDWSSRGDPEPAPSADPDRAESGTVFVDSAPSPNTDWKVTEETVLDLSTGLMWSREDFRTMNGRFAESWDEAMQWAEEMNARRYGGFDDWQIASIAEYRTIEKPNWRDTFFTDDEDYYWSRNEINQYVASYISFKEGFAVSGAKERKKFNFSARLVRSAGFVTRELGATPIRTPNRNLRWVALSGN